MIEPGDLRKQVRALTQLSLLEEVHSKGKKVGEVHATETKHKDRRFMWVQGFLADGPNNELAISISIDLSASRRRPPAVDLLFGRSTPWELLQPLIEVQRAAHRQARHAYERSGTQSEGL